MKVKVNYSPTLDEVNELDLALATAPTGECMIGRSPDSYLVLDSPDVSRVHGKFFAHNGNYYFCDLGSRNGSVINGKLAQKNVPIQLKDKDIIRIGDYVMTVEDIIPVSEQLPVTVFKTIDPTLFAGWRVNENIQNINIANPATKVNSKVSHQVSSESAEAFSQAKNEIETSEIEAAINVRKYVIEIQPAANEMPVSVSDLNVDAAKPVLEEITVVQPQDLIFPEEEVVSEVSAEVNGLGVDVDTPVLEEATFVQPQDLNCSIPEAASEIPAEITDQDIDWDAEILPEFTIVQPRETFREPTKTVNEFAPDDNNDFFDLEIPILQEFTNIQPRETFRQPSEMVTEIPAEITDQDIDWDAEIPPEFTIVQPRNVANQSQDIVIEVPPHISNEVIDDEFKVDIGGVEAPKFVDSFTPEFSHEEATFSDETLIESSELFCKVPEAVSNQAADITTNEPPVFRELNVPIEAPVETSGMSDLDALSPLVTEETEADVIPELTLITSASISQLFAEIYDAEEEFTEIAEEVSANKPQQIIAQKNIVLLAHESQKLELADFVNQHQEFFAHNLTIAWPSISEVLHQHAGITISQQVPAATSGGYQTINALVNSGDISAVIFLRDFLIPQTSQANEEALLRSCNINKVLLATNVPTAEALVHYLKYLQQ
ncbi:MAG: FHA domain-containing protein [Aulosira sp. DedQUE10]|nr:FHA domain-containing protein [Aulosira sp. DedQUE10]